MVNSFAGHSSDVITRGPGAMDGETTALARVLKRDRHIVIGGLVFVSLVSWLYILTVAGMGAIAWATEGAAPSLRLEWAPAYGGLLDRKHDGEGKSEALR